jgi:DNA-binding beta-propeller fold protein YncE
MHCVLRLGRDGYLTVVLGRCESDRFYEPRPYPNELASTVALRSPTALAVDASGALYVAEAEANRVVRVDPKGQVITVAGNRQPGLGRDGGLAKDTPLDHPVGLAIDPAGNLYVAQDRLQRVRKIAVGTGIVSTVAGTGHRGSSGEGDPGREARLCDPTGLALDDAGGLYVTERGCARVRRIDLQTGKLTDALGSPKDGTPLVDPVGVLALRDRIVVADAGRHVVLEVDRNGRQRVIAGTGTRGGLPVERGVAVQTALDSPFSLALDAEGAVVVGDMGHRRLCRIDRSGRLETIAGNGGLGYLGDGGPARDAVLSVDAMAFDGKRQLYVADRPHHRVRRIELANGLIDTVAGNGMPGFTGDGGPARDAEFFAPRDVAVDSQGRVWILDEWRVRRYDPRSGNVETVVGGGPVTRGLTRFDERTSRLLTVRSDGPVDPSRGRGRGAAAAGDRQGLQLRLQEPVSLALGADRLFIMHDGRREDGFDLLSLELSSGVVHRAGPRREARIPPAQRRLFLRADGQLLRTSAGQNRVTRLDPRTAVEVAVAGTGQAGFGGDGGPASQAVLKQPAHAVVDSKGNTYIADAGNKRIRRVDTSGMITTVELKTAPDSFWPQALALESDDRLLVGTGSQIWRLKLPEARLEHVAGVETSLVWP